MLLEWEELPFLLLLKCEALELLLPEDDFLPLDLEEDDFFELELEEDFLLPPEDPLLRCTDFFAWDSSKAFRWKPCASRFGKMSADRQAVMIIFFIRQEALRSLYKTTGKMKIFKFLPPERVLRRGGVLRRGKNVMKKEPFDDFDALLRLANVETLLPPSFQSDVWRKIARTRENRLRLFVETLLERLTRPLAATATVLLMITAGLWIGSRETPSDTKLVYVQSVSPFVHLRGSQAP